MKKKEFTGNIKRKVKKEEGILQSQLHFFSHSSLLSHEWTIGFFLLKLRRKKRVWKLVQNVCLKCEEGKQTIICYKAFFFFFLYPSLIIRLVCYVRGGSSFGLTQWVSSLLCELCEWSNEWISESVNDSFATTSRESIVAHKTHNSISSGSHHELSMLHCGKRHWIQARTCCRLWICGVSGVSCVHALVLQDTIKKMAKKKLEDEGEGERNDFMTKCECICSTNVCLYVCMACFKSERERERASEWVSDSPLANTPKTLPVDVIWPSGQCLLHWMHASARGIWNKEAKLFKENKTELRRENHWNQ